MSVNERVAGGECRNEKCIQALETTIKLRGNRFCQTDYERT